MSAFPSAPLAHVFLCLYDTAVVFLEACQALVKYGLHVSERWHAAQAERVRAPLFWLRSASRHTMLSPYSDTVCTAFRFACASWWVRLSAGISSSHSGCDFSEMLYIIRSASMPREHEPIPTGGQGVSICLGGQELVPVPPGPLHGAGHAHPDAGALPAHLVHSRAQLPPGEARIPTMIRDDP